MLTLLPALAIFLLSGFAALLYQVVWQRLLIFFSGADVHSATIVVSAFMAGMGCGSFVGGHVADRVSRGRSIVYFAAAELSIAGFGFFSTHTFYDTLYLRYGDLATGPAATGAVLFVALLWPTFFMGASLPLLSRGLTRQLNGAASTVGWLYAVNTGGAALGAFAGTWILVPQLGLEGSLEIAAALNLLCAVAALPLARVHSRGETGVIAAAEPPLTGGRAGAVTRQIALWPLLFALSGFVGLSLEIVWFRLLGVMLKSTAFTFGTLLTMYLGGLGLGGAVGSALAARMRRPAAWFLLLQAGAGSYAAISLVLFLTQLHPGGTFEWFSDYFRNYDGVDPRAAVIFWRGLGGDAGNASRDALRAYVLLPALLIVPPTVMAGMSFPLLQRVVHTDLDRVGRRVGLLLASNVLGSTAGAFVTGVLLLDWIGTAGTLRLLCGLSLVFAATAIGKLSFSRRSTRRGLTGALAAAGALLIWFMPANKVLWSQLHGVGSQLTFVGEDATGLSVLRGERRDFRRTTVFVNGLGQSWLPYGGIHTILGALPAFIHEQPRRAAIVGLGSGDTLFALNGRRELQAVVSVEIIGAQLDTLRDLAAWQGYPGLTAILNDRRIQHVEGDGRRYLSRSRETFDIIEADALRPHSAYAGNLYSDAYFRLVRRRLTPTGVAVSWAPTERVLRTFLAVFPHVVHQGQIVMGSDSPIRIDPEAARSRLAESSVTAYYGAAGVDIAALLEPFLSAEWRVYGPSDRRALEDLNTDLHPRDEFDLPALVTITRRGAE